QDSPSPWLLMRPDVAKKAVTAMKRGALNAWSNIFRFGASAVHHTRKALGLYGQEELQRQQEFYAQPFSQRQYSFPESWPVVGGFPITFSEEAKGIIAGPSHGPVYDILESLTEEGVEF